MFLYGNCFLTENYICLFLDKLVDLINQIKEAGMKVLVKIAIIMLGQQPFSTQVLVQNEENISSFHDPLL